MRGDSWGAPCLRGFPGTIQTQNQEKVNTKYSCRSATGGPETGASISASARRHPQGPVEANYLTVEHAVINDVRHQARVFLGAAEP